MDRFYNKTKPTANGCIEWQSALDEHGYGWFKLDGRMHRAHRVAYALAHGGIPEGQWVLHKCDNPRCVNPDHLFLGNQAVNMADMAAKGRNNYGGYRGKQLPQAKLDEDAVRFIRSSSMSQAALADKFDVSRRAIRNVRDYLAWSHVK